MINKTNIVLSNEEQTLLNKGLIYNLSYKQKDWIKTLATEAETAISQLPISEQEYLRYQVATSINNTVGTRIIIQLLTKKKREY